MSPRHHASLQSGSLSQDRTNTLDPCNVCRLQSANRSSDSEAIGLTTAFHQSAHTSSNLLDHARFRRRPPSGVETTSDRRPSLLLASQIPHQPRTASGSRVTSSLEAVCGLFSGRVNDAGISIDGGITPGQPPSHRTSQISSASGATQSRWCLLVRQAHLGW